MTQHRSKSPVVMILLSTKILSIIWRPSSSGAEPFWRRGFGGLWLVVVADRLERVRSRPNIGFGKIVGLVLDLLERLLNIGIVRATLQDGFVFENGRGELAHVHVASAMRLAV